MADGAYNQVPQITTTFNVTLSSVAWTAPATGSYRLVVNGAAGGNAGNQGRGGRSEGTIDLTAGDVLYVCVGEAGNMAPRREGGRGGGGYNGGGNGTGYPASAGFGGGGATHIAYKNNRGELYNYSSNRDEVLIVAGGGGGSDDQGQHSYPVREDGAGGAGGGFIAGTNGQRGTSDMAYWRDGSRQAWYGAGFGRGNSASCSEDSGGGGGGWVGGATSNYHEGGGAGGTGYINESMLYDYASYSNQNSGHGNATISLLDSSQFENYMNNVKIWDMAAPNVPYNISIDGKTDSSGNSTLIIKWERPNDNGTDYWHKVESYNADIGELLNTSQSLKSTSTSGVKGYHYYIDNNSTGTVTTSNTFTSSQEIEISLDDQQKWIHIAAVDNVGNLGETVHYQIPQAIVINYHANDLAQNVYGDTSTTHVNGHINSQIVVKGGSNIQIKGNVTNANLGDTAYTKVGYLFAGWNIESSAKVGGSDTGENGVKYTGEFLKVGSSWNYDQLFNKYGPIVNLYAIWEPIRYNVVFNGNANWNTDEVGEQYTQELRYDHPEKLTPAKFDREKGDKWDGETQNQGYDFIGWGKTPEQTTPNWNEQQTVVNLTTTPDGNVPMYALWKKDLSLIFNLSGGKYNNNSNPIKLSATVYNSTKEYTFNINGGRTPANLPKYTIQNGTILAYGNVISNGKNSILTKSTSNNQLYRFLGWSTSNGAELPNNNMIVYDNGHTLTYTINSNRNLYAVWEEVLTVNISLNRTLGTLRFQDETAEEAWHRENKFNLQADTPVVTLETILIPGEQGGYKTTPMGNVTEIKVEFDDTLHKYYEQHNDGLNPVNDEALALNPDAIDGLDRLITTEFDHTRKFYIPEYIGDINPKKYYDVDFTITGDSFYWSYVHGTKEVIKVDGKVYIIDDEDIEIPGDGTVDGVITEFRTRIKQG